MSRSPKQRCTSTTRAGRPCKAWSVPGTDPPRCSAHLGSPTGDSGGAKPAQTQPGHAVAAVQRLPAKAPAPLPPYPSQDLPARRGLDVDIDARIADLNFKIEQLSQYLDDVEVGAGKDAINVDQYARLLSLYGQLTSRLGRLLRDKQQIAPEDESWLQLCFSEALDQASEILGVKL